nr:MAG TPA_asm: hypothetical protein [Caudoviricetes sp.]
MTALRSSRYPCSNPCALTISYTSQGVYPFFAHSSFQCS